MSRFHTRGVAEGCNASPSAESGSAPGRFTGNVYVTGSPYRRTREKRRTSSPSRILAPFARRPAVARDARRASRDSCRAPCRDASFASRRTPRARCAGARDPLRLRASSIRATQGASCVTRVRARRCSPERDSATAVTHDDGAKKAPRCTTPSTPRPRGTVIRTCPQTGAAAARECFSIEIVSFPAPPSSRPPHPRATRVAECIVRFRSAHPGR